MSKKQINACLDIPRVSFCESLIEVNLSEIIYLLIAKANLPYFDNTIDANWIDRISDGSIQLLPVIADIAAPDETTISLSGNRTITTLLNRTMTIDIDETNDDNYSFCLDTEMGKEIKLWYITRANLLYGGNGIVGEIKLHLINGRGDSEIERFSGTFKWSKYKGPIRQINIIPSTIERIINVLGDGNGNAITANNKLLTSK